MYDYKLKYSNDFKIPTFNFNQLVTQTVDQINENSTTYKSKLFGYVLGLFFVVFLTMLAGFFMFLLIFIGI